MAPITFTDIFDAISASPSQITTGVISLLLNTHNSVLFLMTLRLDFLNHFVIDPRDFSMSSINLGRLAFHQGMKELSAKANSSSISKISGMKIE
jgi:hypothetical protein